MELKPFLMICIGFSLMIGEGESATFRHTMNTSSGYCFTKKYGMLKIGEDAYDNKKCVRVTCENGALSGVACEAVKPFGKCTVISRIGQNRHFPNCCPTLGCQI